MQNSILNMNFKHDPVLTSLKKPCTWGEAGCKWGEGLQVTIYHCIWSYYIRLLKTFANTSCSIEFVSMIQQMFRISHILEWKCICVPNDTNSLFSEIMHPLQINHNGQHRRLLLEDWWSQNKKLLKIKRYWFLLKLTKSTTASGELGSTGGGSMGGGSVGGAYQSICPILYLHYHRFCTIP